MCQTEAKVKGLSIGWLTRDTLTGERLGFGRTAQAPKENHLRLRSVKKKEDEFGYGVFGYRNSIQQRQRQVLGDFTMNKVYGCFYK